ncbi:MAG TPA: T9SS type A sorting domain-containing protein, partial [Saprospiraceae bacterium]|nr:T9SS type A sorting domain-containing protein [Saprospiraceae bacterium]
PIRWDYLDNPYRRRLHDVTQALLYLRNNYDVFETTDYNIQLGPGAIRQIWLNDNAAGQAVVVIANVSTTVVNNQTLYLNGPPGWWYEYYTGDSLYYNGFPVNTITLQPGEYRLYLNQYVPLPPGVIISGTNEQAGFLSGMEVYPNPAGAIFAVDFALRESAQVQTQVFDFTGRLVASVPPTALPAGEHQIEIETAGWPAGVYQVVLRDSNGAQLTRKLLKM